jgi:uroporphyrinogen decarboxylase
MKHRDRVLSALHHEPTDRPPFQATFTPEFADCLRTYFNLPPQKSEPHHREWYGYDLEILTQQDAFQAGAGWVTNY